MQPRCWYPSVFVRCAMYVVVRLGVGDDLPAVVVVSVDVQDLLALDTQNTVGRKQGQLGSKIQEGGDVKKGGDVPRENALGEA